MKHKTGTYNNASRTTKKIKVNEPLISLIEVNYKLHQAHAVPNIFKILIQFYAWVNKYDDIMPNNHKESIVNDIIRYTNSFNNLLLILYCNKLVGFVLYKLTYEEDENKNHVNIIWIKNIVIQDLQYNANNNNFNIEGYILQYFRKEHTDSKYIIIEIEPFTQKSRRSSTKSILNSFGCMSMENNYNK